MAGRARRYSKLALTFCLCAQGTSNAHGYRAGDELGDSTDNDDPRVAQGCQASSEAEWNRQTIAQAYDDVSVEFNEKVTSAMTSVSHCSCSRGSALENLLAWLLNSWLPHDAFVRR